MATSKKSGKKTAKKTARKARSTRRYNGVSVTLTFKLDYEGGIKCLPKVENINDVILYGLIGDVDGNRMSDTFIKDEETAWLHSGALVSMTLR